MPCLLKLPDKTWVHYSRGTKTAKTRDFKREPTPYKLPEDEPTRPGGPLEYALAVTMSKADAALAPYELGFWLENLRHEEGEKWRQALDLLERLDFTPSDPPPGRIVPKTALRRLYLKLRQMPFSEKEAMANDPGISAHLQELFREGVDQFDSYDNYHDTFCATRPWWIADPMAAFSAHELQAMLDPAKALSGVVVRSSGGPSLGFTTVDYEVSPFRTTNNAIFDDGTRTNMGLGGMDLLLRSDDGVPVVAEIKGPGDNNLFLALVQTLTYAAEMTTHLQFLRLKKSYPNAFHDLREGSPRSDVYIIYLDDDEPPLKEASMRIARELLLATEGVASRVRRIAFLRAQRDSEGKLIFTCEQLTP